MQEIQYLQNIKVLCARIHQECNATEVNDIKNAYCMVLREIHTREKNQPPHVYQYGFDLFSKGTIQNIVTALEKTLKEYNATQAEFYGITLGMYHLRSVLINWNASHAFGGIRMMLGMPLSNAKKDHIAWAINHEINQLLGFSDARDWMKERNKSEFRKDTKEILSTFTNEQTEKVNERLIQELGDQTNDPEAQFALGVTFDEAQQYNLAIVWYKKSAEQGYASAQHNLAVLYDAGRGTEKDLAEAAKWYRKAAGQGEARSQFNLGNFYFHGHGVDQDHEEAVSLWRMAAYQGNAEAQYNLGVAYWDGTGIEKDPKEAKRLWRMAADQGNAEAQALMDKLNTK